METVEILEIVVGFNLVCMLILAEVIRSDRKRIKRLEDFMNGILYSMRYQQIEEWFNDR